MKANLRIGRIAVASLAMIGIAWPGLLSAVEPDKAESRIVATADTAGDQKPAKKIPSINPLSGDADAIEIGAKLYYTWCVQCHGHKANGESRFGKYAGDLTKFWRGYKEFVVIVKNGRVDKMMPPWRDVLDDENIAKVGAFLETLAEEGANWQ